MLKYITLFVILGAVLSSCSKSSNPSSPGSSAFTQPKAGSSFTFDEYQTDTTTGQPVLGTRDTSVQTFIQTGISYMGKTNVSKIISVSNMTQDTTYLNYEANGDLSVWGSSGLSSTMSWLILPTGSKTSNSITSDTTVTILGIPTETKTVFTLAYVDDETMTVKGQSISVTKLKEMITLTITTAGVPATQTQSSFAYFAPSLGYLTKTETPVQVGIFSTGRQQGQLSTLIDYTEK
jgi:hypothetical protein